MLSVSILALLLLLALTPPLVNVNRLQRRIAASMSASLGRPVHLDRVSLHLLPVPGFTLENLVVSEDPEFGNEPTIRANTVEATLRPSSLWRRQVEFSTIRFVEPSLNLVRNQDGRWNLQSLLMHAAQVQTAPTGQQKAGPAPRFPYIEATGARVNLKLGQEKEPFSLTEADFALWLPTPTAWRIRLSGKPARTDLNVADTGTVTLEGGLERAAQMADVPVNLQAGWRNAPLGEASRLLTGQDAGWRGSLGIDAALDGALGAAHLSANIHLHDLHRADFVPADELQLDIDCTASLDAPAATLHDPDCSLPTPRRDSAKAGGKVVAIADSIMIPEARSTGLRVGMTNVGADWLLDWVRLFSQRIPAEEHPGGLFSGSMVMSPGVGWQGQIQGEVQGTLPWDAPDSTAPSRAVSALMSASVLTLNPVNLARAGEPALLVSGDASLHGYDVRLNGTITPRQLAQLRQMAPPLGDGLDAVAPQGTKAEHVSLVCSRAWNAPATCAAVTAESPRPPRHKR